MSSNNNKKKQPSTYVRYSGIAFEMVAAIGLGIWGGMKLDEWLNTSPAFVVVGSVTGFTASIILIIKSLPKE